jgi:phage terminase large subunit-like protein
MKLKRASELCLTDLWFLTTQVLYHHDRHKYGDFHKWACAEIGKDDILFEGPPKDEGFYGENKYWRPPLRFRFMSLFPRDHFKSTILTIAHCIQQILRNPGGSYLILSGKDEHALLFSDEIRKQFTYNKRLTTLFPPWKAKTPDSLGSVSQWTTPAKAFFGGLRREPTVVATGFKSRLESRHYDGGYLDDCMGEDDTTEAGLQDVRENYKKVIPLIDSDGFVIMPGTRKHYNDLYQALMDTEAYRVNVRHGLEHPEKMCDLDECSRFALPHKAPDFKTGVPLEPRRMTRQDYEAKLKECQVDPKLGQSYFWHEYMNIPFSPTDRKYQQRWFVKIDSEMIPGRQEPFDPLRKYISMDTAWKDDEHPSGYDFTVIVVGGFDDFGRLYILDIFRNREWTVKKGMEAVTTAMRAYGISHVIYQKTGEMTWPGDLRDACRRANLPLVTMPLTLAGQSAKAKSQRLLWPQNSFEAGRVFFRRSCENFEDCVNEFCNVGRWTNDDIADAISNFYDERVRVFSPTPPSDRPFTSPFRPMAWEGDLTRGAFRQMQQQSPFNPKDPLGRFGMAGKAESRTSIPELTNGGQVIRWGDNPNERRN